MRPPQQPPQYGPPSQPFYPPPPPGAIPPRDPRLPPGYVRTNVAEYWKNARNGKRNLGIVGGILGLFLILCCVGGVLDADTNPSGVSSADQNVANSGQPTNTPGPTATAGPTATPVPTATSTPRPVGIGQHMSLGHDYAQNADGFSIVSPADHFAASDQFAFVVNLDSGIGTTQAQLLLVQLHSGGAESVVRSIPESVSNPDFAAFAQKFSTSSLMLNNAAGSY